MTNQQKTNIDIIANDLSYIRRDVTDIKLKLDHEYVTRESFEPIKRVVYGLVSLILTGVGLAIVALVINKQP